MVRSEMPGLVLMAVSAARAGTTYLSGYADPFLRNNHFGRASTSTQAANAGIPLPTP
jgi:hypothetical protein